MLNTVSTLVFLGYLATGLAVALRDRVSPSAHHRLRLVSAFLLYALGASFGAGLARVDAWPFSKWPMAGGLADANAANTRLVCVDSEGLEQPIDSRAWQPLGFDELNPWMHRSFPRLGDDARDRVAAHLLEHAEDARQRAVAGKGVGYFDRVLGPLTAPYFDLHPRTWSLPSGPPPRPFVKLRVYRETWNQEQRRRNPLQVQRVLVHEYPHP